MEPHHQESCVKIKCSSNGDIQFDTVYWIHTIFKTEINSAFGGLQVAISIR